jgi:hypothetical protein
MNVSFGLPCAQGAFTAGSQGLSVTVEMYSNPSLRE